MGRYRRDKNLRKSDDEGIRYKLEKDIERESAIKAFRHKPYSTAKGSDTIEHGNQESK